MSVVDRRISVAIKRAQFLKSTVFETSLAKNSTAYVM